jgi:hypothetical protein
MPYSRKWFCYAPPPQSLQISLKISKEQPETIDRKRQTINLMATRKDTKPKQWSTKDYTKNKAHEPH